MTSSSKLARYPREYGQTLLMLPLDGEPFEIAFPSESEATWQRLQFYNFLKFVKRNRRECAHLVAQGRADRVTISLAGKSLIFRLRTATAQTGFGSALAQAAQDQGIPIPEVPALSTDNEALNPEFDPEHITFDETPQQINPLDLLNKALEKKDDES